jgi:drug/metabolite transporter (DMT)-like permease
MSSEGVTFVSRVVLVILMVVATAFFRAVMGPGERRGQYILAGTLGGISLGAVGAFLIYRARGIDASVICASLGILVGWTVAWFFARRLPREAN